MTNQSNQKPPDAYIVFCGEINPSSVNRIFNALAAATDPNLQIKRVHLLIQSNGGYINDGICLYNFFKTLPVELIVYNCGTVQSIATVAFLGAKRRITSASATFMIHKTSASPQFVTASKIKAVSQMLITDDARVETILRNHVTLTAENWTDHQSHDLIFTGEEAVALKIATEIGEFSPAPGSRIFNI